MRSVNLAVPFWAFPELAETNYEIFSESCNSSPCLAPRTRVDFARCLAAPWVPFSLATPVRPNRLRPVDPTGEEGRRSLPGPAPPGPCADLSLRRPDAFPLSLSARPTTLPALRGSYPSE